MKKIKSYFYSLINSELTIFIEDLNNRQYSVATISEVKEKDCEKIAEEVLEELDYQIVEVK